MTTETAGSDYRKQRKGLENSGSDYKNSAIDYKTAGLTTETAAGGGVNRKHAGVIKNRPE